MGEKPVKQINPTTSFTSISLPPGCRFYPTDEQLLCHYLTSKNTTTTTAAATTTNGIDVIKEINLYNFDPFDLPETASFRFGRGGRRRHWYCYVSRVLERRGKRRAGCGYWKKKGKVRDVMSGGAGGSGTGKVIVGTRKTFVFYLGDDSKGVAADAVRTDWFMYEYALVDHPKASFVLCRVFVKSRQANNLSENVLSSCAEESVATLRHIGIQFDGCVTSTIAEDKPHHDDSADCDNEGLKYPARLIDVLDYRITSRPTDDQMESNGYVTSNAAPAFDALTAQQFVAIAEGDFIELDDLLCPLPGID